MRIFISYARDNRTAVAALTDDLQALGHEVWYDGQLKGGQHWWDEILRRIAESDVYVFGLSVPALDSTPCLAELDYANAVLRPLLPVQVDHVAPGLVPSTLAAAQFVDYTKADKQAAFMLHAALSQMPAHTPLPDPPPMPPTLPKSRLHDLKQQIDDPGEMNRTQQLRLLDDLTHELQVKGQHDDVVGLLARFKHRSDVMADIERRIDLVVGSAAPQSGHGASAAPQPGQGSSAAPTRGPIPDPAWAGHGAGVPPPPPPPGRPVHAAAPNAGFGPPGHSAASTGAWSPGFMTGMIVAGVLCGGIVPLVAGMAGYSDLAKRRQAVTLLWVGGVILAVSILIVLAASASSPDSGY